MNTITVETAFTTAVRPGLIGGASMMIVETAFTTATQVGMSGGMHMMKTITSSLPEPVRTLDMNDLREYDQNGNLTYRRYPDGVEVWWEYDDNGNMIHYRNSDGFAEWYTYDENNKLISTRTNGES